MKEIINFSDIPTSALTALAVQSLAQQGFLNKQLTHEEILAIFRREYNAFLDARDNPNKETLYTKLVEA